VASESRPVTAEARGTLQALRAENTRRLIEALRVRGSASRAELARATGLSRSTVSTLTADLLAGGLVVERAEQHLEHRAVQSGRPPVLLTLDPSAGVAVGIDFGHSHVRVAISDLGHEILAEDIRAVDVDANADVAIGQGAELVEELLAQAGARVGAAIGVAMGVPGPIELDTGTVGAAVLTPGWVGVRPADEMERRLGVAVRVENDANLGALAETTWGAGAGARDVAYLKISSGLGAGLVLDGRIYHGGAGTAGELGHTPVEESGAVCRCGNRGCLETVASAPGVLEPLRRAYGADLSLHDALERAAAGDQGCRRVIADAGGYVGRAVAALCNLINPDRVIVGGELSVAGDLLLDPIREAVGRYALPTAAAHVQVVAGVLGERAEVLGALALTLIEPGDRIPAGLPRARRAA
jgi:predicted NBD/HSP70 family sugar kinase